MSELINRISAQRLAINTINKSNAFSSPLFGLTQKSIERWSRDNNLDHNHPIAIELEKIAIILLSLANKSQEQVTEEHENMSLAAIRKIEEIRISIENLNR